MSAKLLITLFFCLKIRNGIAISDGEDAPPNIAPYRVSLRVNKNDEETQHAEGTILSVNKILSSASALAKNVKEYYTAKDLTAVVGEGSTVPGSNNGNKVPLYIENIIKRYTQCLARNVKTLRYNGYGKNVTIEYVKGSQYNSAYFACERELEKLPPAAEQRYEIVAIITHEDFDPDTHKNDIALLYIKGKIVFGSNIKPIGLGALPRQADDEVLIVGNGWIDNCGTRPEKLQMITATITSQDCNDEMNLCLEYKTKDQGLCFYDGGAGLVNYNQVVGVSSFVLLCGEPNLFANVTYFFDWIMEH